MERYWLIIKETEKRERRSCAGAIPGTIIPYVETVIDREEHENFFFGSMEELMLNIEKHYTNNPGKYDISLTLLAPDGKKFDFYHWDKNRIAQKIIQTIERGCEKGMEIQEKKREERRKIEEQEKKEREERFNYFKQEIAKIVKIRDYEITSDEFWTGIIPKLAKENPELLLEIADSSTGFAGWTHFKFYICPTCARKKEEFDCPIEKRIPANETGGCWRRGGGYWRGCL